MNPAEFANSPSGKLVPTIGGQMAFVPYPLPPQLDLMLAVSRDGAWTRWIQFFLEMVVGACNATSATLAQLDAVRQDFRERISDAGSSSRLMRIVDELFVSPVVSIPLIAEVASVTYPAARSMVDRLRELDILDEVDNTSNPKLFICWQIVDLSEGRPSQPVPEVHLGKLGL